MNHCVFLILSHERPLPLGGLSACDVVAKPCYWSGFPGVNYEQTVIDLIDDCAPDNGELFDLCYAENLTIRFARSG